MSVGIAALSNNGMGCVLAADQMIAAHHSLGYEFEEMGSNLLLAF